MSFLLIEVIQVICWYQLSLERMVWIIKYLDVLYSTKANQPDTVEYSLRSSLVIWTRFRNVNRTCNIRLITYHKFPIVQRIFSFVPTSWVLLIFLLVLWSNYSEASSLYWLFWSDLSCYACHLEWCRLNQIWTVLCHLEGGLITEPPSMNWSLVKFLVRLTLCWPIHNCIYIVCHNWLLSIYMKPA